MKGYILTMFIAVFLLGFTAKNFPANDSSLSNIKNLSVAIENLKTGINADNDGLRKCRIYFAGKYKVSGLIDALKEQLRKEKNPRIRILISLSLYQIEDKESIEFLKMFTINDKDEEVRRICSAIYNEYWKSSRTVQNTSPEITK